MTNLKLILGILTLATALTVPAQSQSFLTNGLVAYFPCNGNVDDASGNGLVSTPFGIRYTSNRFGHPYGAILLDGSSSYVRVAYSDQYNFPPDGQFTLSTWFKINGLGSGIGGIGSLIVKCPDAGYLGAWDYGMDCNYNGEYVVWAGMNNQTPGLNTNLLQTNVWYQGVMTYSNALWRVYLNGTLLVSTNTSYQITQSAGGIALGRKGYYSYDYFNGAMSDVRIYNVALSPAEVAQLYALEFPVALTIQKAVYLTFTNLSPGSSYQVQSSTDLVNWTNQGTAFTATNSYLVYPQYWNVPDWNQLYFRLQLAP